MNDPTSSVTSPRSGPGPLPTLTDRQPARRKRPQCLVQLGVRAALRRNLRAADRGHRRRSRNLDQSYDVVYDSLTWLGLDWDEGPGVGGPYGPYLQSER